MVEAVFFHASKADETHPVWEFTDDSLRCQTAVDDVVEYWGSINSWGVGAGHYLTLAHRYPWMTVDVSKDDFF